MEIKWYEKPTMDTMIFSDEPDGEDQEGELLLAPSGVLYSPADDKAMQFNALVV